MKSRLLFCISFTFSLTALCQDTASHEGDVFSLDPFVVEENATGYLSASSMLGGRMNTELRDTAVAISVLTPELLEDIGALSVVEAVAWAPNAVPQDEIGGQNIFSDYSVSFRGLGTSFQARNFFIWYVNSDYYNTSRIDISRGPNSLVFGDAGIAGISNVSTQRAVFANTAEVYTHGTGEGGWRSHLKANYKISDNLALMGAVVYDDNQYWQDRAYALRKGYYVTLGYKPFKSTRVDIEYEEGEIERVLADALFDVHSKWNGQAITEPFTSGNKPLPEQGISAYKSTLTYNPALPGQGIVNWEGWGRSAGSQRQILDRRLPGLAKEGFLMPYLGFHNSPPNKTAENPFKTWSAFINRNFGDRIYLEAAYNFQQQERILDYMFMNQLTIDVNRFMPDGSDNPGFGKYYTDTAIRTTYNENRVSEYRFSAAVRFDCWGIGSGRLLASAGTRSDQFRTEGHYYVRVNNADNPDITSSVNRIQIRRYLDDRDLPVDYPEYIGNVQTGWPQIGGRTEEKEIQYIQAAFSGAFIDQKLNVLIGVRHDKFKRYGNNGIQEVDPVTKEVLGIGPNILEESENITTMSGGGVYHLTEWISLAANYAESFFPIGSRLDINGGAIAAYENDGYDLGLRFSLLEGRINASLNYYSNEQRNVDTAGASASINGLWQILEEAGIVGSGLEVEPGYKDFYSYQGTGFEFETVANVTTNWKIFFNVSFPETTQIDGLNDTREYYESNLETWLSGRAQLVDPFDVLLFDQRLTNLENFLASFQEGQSIPNTFDYTLNLYTDYAFNEGALRGFSVGMGIRMRGQRLVTYGEGEPLYSGKYETLSAKLGYDFNWQGVEFRLQLNVDNLLDKTFLSVTGFEVQEGVWVPSFYFPQNPRTFKLSLNAKF